MLLGKRSVMIRGKYFIYVILAIFFQAIGGIFGKYAAITTISISPIAIISNFFYISALFCMVLQALVWQQALIHYPLSFAYPFMSLTYFVVLCLSAILFHEEITTANILGLILISVGITTLSRDKMCEAS